jgi:hypothetical protein
MISVYYSHEILFDILVTLRLRKVIFDVLLAQVLLMCCDPFSLSLTQKILHLELKVSLSCHGANEICIIGSCR